MPFLLPPTLSRKLELQFEPSIRQRGLDYYRRKAVRIRHGSESEVDARVAGSRDYDVMLSVEGPKLRMWCDCAYFDSNGPCKHLWATVLAAEGRGLLSDVLGKELRVDYAAADPEFDLDFADDFIPQRTPPKPAPKPVLVVRQPPPVPAWRQRIEEFGKRHDHADHAPAAFSPKRQILYVVEIPPSRTAGAVVMSIAFRSEERRV